MLSIEETKARVMPYLPTSVSMAGWALGSHAKKEIPQMRYWRFVQSLIDTHAKGFELEKIKQLRPNEPEKNLKWRELAGEPITMQYWHRAIAELSRVLNGSTATLSLDENTEQYINENRFDGTTLYKAFTCNYFDKLINQPNGLTVAYPLEYIQAYGVSPVQHFEYTHILYIDDGVVLWLSEEESEIEEMAEFYHIKDERKDSYLTKVPSYTPKVKRTVKKAVFNAATKDYFFRFEGKEQAVIEINAGTNPAFQNGGLGKDVTGMKHVYFSFLHPAIGFGNLALNSLSDFLSVKANAAFPHMWGIPQKCPGEGPTMPCQGGHIIRPNLSEAGGELTQEACHVCKPHGGFGQIFVVSPDKVHLKKQNPDMPTADTTPLGFIEANPENVRLTGEFMDKELQKFVEGLCLFSKKGEGVESGMSIGLQMEATLALMRRIGPVVFGNLEKLIQAFQAYIVGTSEGVKVEQPIKYGIASEGDVLEFVFQSFKDDAPPMVRRQKIWQYLNSYVGGNSTTLKAVEVMELIDPFYYYSFRQKNELLGNGGMTMEQYNISTQGFQAAATAVKENPMLMPSELTEITKAKIISTNVTAPTE